MVEDASDSARVYYIKRSGVRKVTSIRVDSGIHSAFKRACIRSGASTCDLLEKMEIALTTGLIEGFNHGVVQSTTITALVDSPRVVKRVRRRVIEFEGEVIEQPHLKQQPSVIAFSDSDLKAKNLKYARSWLDTWDTVNYSMVKNLTTAWLKEDPTLENEPAMQEVLKRLSGKFLGRSS